MVVESLPRISGTRRRWVPAGSSRNETGFVVCQLRNVVRLPLDNLVPIPRKGSNQWKLSGTNILQYDGGTRKCNFFVSTRSRQRGSVYSPGCLATPRRTRTLEEGVPRRRRPPPRYWSTFNIIILLVFLRRARIIEKNMYISYFSTSRVKAKKLRLSTADSTAVAWNGTRNCNGDVSLSTKGFWDTSGDGTALQLEIL